MDVMEDARAEHTIPLKLIGCQRPITFAKVGKKENVFGAGGFLLAEAEKNIYIV